MKNLFLTICCTFLVGSMFAQLEYDITMTAQFEPNTIQVTETSNMELTITNLTLDGSIIPAGDITTQVTIGSGAEATASNPPTGTDADKFDWSFLGSNIWYGTSNTDMPAFALWEIDVPVEGTAISSNNSNYIASIVNPDSDTNTGNNTGSSLLEVTALLPVEFTYFNVRGTDCATVGLEWETAQEINNEGFHVERMLEQNGKFESVGFVKGSGDTKKATQYSFKDDISRLGTSPEVIYYRLKQVDLDGSSDYSEIIRAKIDCEEVLAISGYPNPVVNDFNIEIEGIAGTNNVTIFNNQGQLVKTIVATRNAANTIDMRDFDSGLYTINVLNADNEIEKSMKVIKISN